MDTINIKIDSWFGCYKSSWSGEIVPEAFAHPAKYSRALIRHIYQHALGNGWLQAGDTVADPFGGVALGALDAMRQGLHWRGCELEPKFVAMGAQNIELWNTRYSAHFPGWGTAELRQGDSRELASVLGLQAEAVVSSPPYENSLDNILPRAHDHKNNGAVATFRRTGKWPERRPEGQDYGSDPANIGNDTGDTFWQAARTIVEQSFAILRPGGHAIWVTKAFVKNKERQDFPGQWRALCEAVGFVTVCEHRALLIEDKGSQIDLFGVTHHKTIKRASFFRRLAEKNGSPPIDWETVTCMVKPGGSGSVDAVISSPPFTGVVAIGDPLFLTPGERFKIVPSKSNQPDYGTSPGQLGAMKPGEPPDSEDR